MVFLTSPHLILGDQNAVINFGGVTGGDLSIRKLSNAGDINNYTEVLKLSNSGDVQIFGKLATKEICVNTTSTWCDYVFENGYNLRGIKELEAFLQKNKHLPDVPTEKEVKTNGYNLTEMDAILLKKIEELTLYIIKQQKEIDNLKGR
jgi:hypothetical protein